MTFEGDHTPFNKRRGFGEASGHLNLNKDVLLQFKYSGFWKDDEMDTSLSSPENDQNNQKLASLSLSIIDFGEEPDLIF